MGGSRVLDPLWYRLITGPAWVDWWAVCPTDYRNLFECDRSTMSAESVATTVSKPELEALSFNVYGGKLDYGPNRSTESDPHGKQLKEPGAKADAGKSAITRGCLHYFPRALLAVAELSGIGAKKYSWKGWEQVPDGINRYGDAMGRHELRIEGDYTRRDGDTGVLEACAVAWNACARLELILRQMEKDANSEKS